MNTSNPILALATGLLLCAPVLAHGMVPAGQGHYSGAGTIVTNFNIQTQQITVVDNGAVICRDTDANSIPDHGQGGACLRFADIAPAFNAIYVHDNSVPDNQLAFQVCIDNNGDGICQGGNSGDLGQPNGCNDVILFSHDSNSFGNHNPLYVPRAALESNFQNNCAGNGGFPGYVVITCAGLHNNRFGTAPHQHQVTDGGVNPATTTDLGHGDFCGSPVAAKAYEIVNA